MSKTVARPDAHNATEDGTATRLTTVRTTPGEFVPETPNVQAVTGFLPVGLYGSMLDLTFVCIGAYVQPDGTIRTQAAITSRSRLDLDTARALRAALDTAIKGLTAPTRDQVN